MAKMPETFGSDSPQRTDYKKSASKAAKSKTRNINTMAKSMPTNKKSPGIFGMVKKC